MLRKLLIAAAVVVLLAAAVAFYLWRQATALPEWYTAAPSGTLAGDGSAPAADPGWVPTADGGVQVRNFHQRSRALAPALRPAIKASRATHQGGQIEAGVVANLGAVDRDRLSGDERASLDRAIDAFPSLQERDVYLGVRGEAVKEGGSIRLGADPEVTIGKLSYSLADAAKRLGISEAALRGEIDAELARMGTQPSR